MLNRTHSFRRRVRSTTVAEQCPVPDPYWAVWQGLMDIARQRVEAVLEFAREWKWRRPLKTYEAQRVMCQMHLNWIFDDARDSLRFTFRELCQFCEDHELQDVERARERILAQLPHELLRELARPARPAKFELVSKQFVGREAQFMVDRTFEKGTWSARAGMRSRGASR